MWYDFKDEIPKGAIPSGILKTLIIPDTVKIIRTGAFEKIHKLEKVYIPKSVEVIEENAFRDYGRDWSEFPSQRLEIYCEEEPKPGWLHEIRKEMTEYEITTPEDDAFNFHRSGGSFTSTKVTREVERLHSWNPDFIPVHTHVDRAETASWELIPKRIIIFHDIPEPASGLFRRIVNELKREQEGVADLPIEWRHVDGVGPKTLEIYPYENVPAMFYGNEKLYEYEPDISRKQLKKKLRHRCPPPRPPRRRISMSK